MYALESIWPDIALIIRREEKEENWMESLYFVLIAVLTWGRKSRWLYQLLLITISSIAYDDVYMLDCIQIVVIDNVVIVVVIIVIANDTLVTNNFLNGYEIA